MSPRALNPTIRAAITTAAANILGTEGRTALSTRRLAREANTSTTAIYTYFGSMDDVHRHVRRHAIDDLVRALRAVAVTDDPVADLVRTAIVMVEHGRNNPATYRVMFVDQPPDDQEDPGQAVLALLAALIDRCTLSGRFQPGEQHETGMWAGEVWTIGHGIVMLAMSGLLAPDHVSALHADILYRLCVGLGDERRRARKSVDTVQLPR